MLRAALGGIRRAALGRPLARACSSAPKAGARSGAAATPKWHIPVKAHWVAGRPKHELYIGDALQATSHIRLRNAWLIQLPDQKEADELRVSLSDANTVTQERAPVRPASGARGAAVRAH